MYQNVKGLLYIAAVKDSNAFVLREFANLVVNTRAAILFSHPGDLAPVVQCDNGILTSIVFERLAILNPVDLLVSDDSVCHVKPSEDTGHTCMEIMWLCLMMATIGSQPLIFSDAA